jgi:hypothetical protein
MSEDVAGAGHAGTLTTTAAAASPNVHAVAASELLVATTSELARRLAAITGGDDDRAWGPLVEPFADDNGCPDDRLAVIVDATGIDHLDLSLLLAAAAPAVDQRFVEVLAGVGPVAGTTAGAATPGVTGAALLVVNGLSGWDADVRSRLGSGGALRRAGLIDVAPAPSLLSATVTVPERVVAWLLGDDAIDSALDPLLANTVGLSSDEVVELCRVLQAGVWAAWIHDGVGGGLSMGASALAVLGAPSIVIDLRHLPPTQSLGDVLPAAWREAVLRGGGVVVGPVDPVRDAATLASLPAHPIRPTLLVSAHTWDTTRSAATPFTCRAPRLDPNERRELWTTVLGQFGLGSDLDGAVDTLAGLRLAPEQMHATVQAALADAVARDEPVSTLHLRAAALAHGSNRLVDLAQRVVPLATFDDLVVRDDLMAELQGLPDRHRTRHVVREEWGLGRGGGRGLGLTCLFAGSSGTGKTLAAEVVANALGVDLFVIDLSQIVDKYIGETEKNLERVFSEAEAVNGVLLFDEADALFGKRSDVQSSHDRHANVEVAYLLQRMERYDGVAVLTTNLRGNIDDAFLRRLDVVCNFTEPDVDERRLLWRIHLPPRMPIDDDVDLDELATHLDVSGGVIRNITLTAAHTAAATDRAVAMRDLVMASHREYRKMGRLFKATSLERHLPRQPSPPPPAISGHSLT